MRCQTTRWSWKEAWHLQVLDPQRVHQEKCIGLMVCPCCARFRRWTPSHRQQHLVGIADVCGIVVDVWLIQVMHCLYSQDHDTQGSVGAPKPSYHERDRCCSDFPTGASVAVSHWLPRLVSPHTTQFRYPCTHFTCGNTSFESFCSTLNPTAGSASPKSVASRKPTPTTGCRL